MPSKGTAAFCSCPWTEFRLEIGQRRGERFFLSFFFFFHISKLIVNGRCDINGFSALSRGQIDAKTSDWVFFHSEDASPLNKSGMEAPEGEISLAVT